MLSHFQNHAEILEPSFRATRCNPGVERVSLVGRELLRENLMLTGSLVGYLKTNNVKKTS